MVPDRSHSVEGQSSWFRNHVQIEGIEQARLMQTRTLWIMAGAFIALAFVLKAAIPQRLNATSSPEVGLREATGITPIGSHFGFLLWPDLPLSSGPNRPVLSLREQVCDYFGEIKRIHHGSAEVK
jgi:hypothetical protein